MSHKEFFNALRSSALFLWFLPFISVYSPYRQLIALYLAGYFVNRDDADRIFWMVDRDRSGRINEYEWCEFWVYAHGAPLIRSLLPQ